MEWLTQNWTSLLLLVVVLLFLARRGGMGCGTGQAARDQPADSSTVLNSSNDPMAVDPVSGEKVATATALTSVYSGRVYYFSSRENREKFEANPAPHAASQAGGHEANNRHGKHECC